MSCSSRNSISDSVSRGLIDSMRFLRSLGARRAASSRSPPDSLTTFCRDLLDLVAQLVDLGVVFGRERLLLGDGVGLERSKYSLTGLGQRRGAPRARPARPCATIGVCDGSKVMSSSTTVPLSCFELAARSPCCARRPRRRSRSLRPSSGISRSVFSVSSRSSSRFRSPVSSSIFSWLARSWRLISRLECPARSR